MGGGKGYFFLLFRSSPKVASYPAKIDASLTNYILETAEAKRKCSIVLNQTCLRLQKSKRELAS